MDKKIKKPLRDQVVVSKEAESEKTAGGLLYKPATAEDKHVVGVVVAVGSGRVSLTGTIVPVEVEVGEQVMFNKNMATEVKTGDQTFYILREDQLICTVE